MKKSIGNFKGEDLYLKIANYSYGNRIYIRVDTLEEPYADLTINLPDLMLPDEDYIFVNGDMTKDLRKFLEQKKIISETIYTYPYNLGKYDMVKVDFDKLKEYDPNGFEDYENYKDNGIEL